MERKKKKPSLHPKLMCCTNELKMAWICVQDQLFIEAFHGHSRIIIVIELQEVWWWDMWMNKKLKIMTTGGPEVPGLSGQNNSVMQQGTAVWITFDLNSVRESEPSEHNVQGQKFSAILEERWEHMYSVTSDV